MVMRVVPEAVKRQNLGFFDVSLSFRSPDIGKDVEGEAAVTVLLPPHLEAEPDVAGLKDIGAAVMLDGVPLGDEGLPGAGLHLGQHVPYRTQIRCLRDFLV